jgi:hypothetical protein
LSDAPLILIVEDQYLLHREIEVALTGGGFAVEFVFSGEEALTLMMGGTKTYRADENLKGHRSRAASWTELRKEPPYKPICHPAENGRPTGHCNDRYDSKASCLRWENNRSHCARAR